MLNIDWERLHRAHFAAHLVHLVGHGPFAVLLRVISCALIGLALVVHAIGHSEKASTTSTVMGSEDGEFARYTPEIEDAAEKLGIAPGPDAIKRAPTARRAEGLTKAYLSDLDNVATVGPCFASGIGVPRARGSVPR